MAGKQLHRHDQRRCLAVLECKNRLSIVDDGGNGGWTARRRIQDDDGYAFPHGKAGGRCEARSPTWERPISGRRCCGTDPMAAGPKSLSVLIVDDHEVVRVGLRTVLSRVPGMDVVGEAETGAAAMAECQRLQPDLVLLDIPLPDRSGVGVCRDLLTICPNTRVVFLTICADDENVVSALLAGAHGYVLKEGSNLALIEAIKTVGSGQSHLDPQVTGRTLSLIRSHYSPAWSAQFAGSIPCLVRKNGS
jgi:DNA-binding NarL/FixJ family response regulator